MHALHIAYRRDHSVKMLAQTMRSNATGVGGAIHAARGRVLRAARGKKWRIDEKKLRAIADHIQSTHHQVEAEVGEFIQYPHLLFQPIRMALTLAIPMLIPLFFMPTRLLLVYPAFLVSWYLVCTLIFATEVAMRPPWYKKGLPIKEQPPYWGGFIHNPQVHLQAAYESVEFLSPVIGTTLRGWFVPPRPGKDAPASTNMVVFVHGVGRDRRNFLRHAQHFLEKGYSCLLFDFSEHGLSDNISKHSSRGSAFGAREQYDVIAAVEFLKKHKGATHVAIVGTSCGASSAILAASLRPDLAVCVVAENPFTRADDLLRHHMDVLLKNYLSQNSHQTVRRAVFWLAGKLLMFRMGYYWQSYGAVDAVSLLTCPLLVLHSTEDDIVPFEQGHAIYNKALLSKDSDKDMVSFCSFSDAAHCALYDRDPELWTDRVLMFVDNAFARADCNSHTQRHPKAHIQ